MPVPEVTFFAAVIVASCVSLMDSFWGESRFSLAWIGLNWPVESGVERRLRILTKFSQTQLVLTDVSHLGFL